MIRCFRSFGMFHLQPMTGITVIESNEFERRSLSTWNAHRTLPRGTPRSNSHSHCGWDGPRNGWFSTSVPVFLSFSYPFPTQKQVHVIQKSQKFQKTRDKTGHPKGVSVDEGGPHWIHAERLGSFGRCRRSAGQTVLGRATDVENCPDGWIR